MNDIQKSAIERVLIDCLRKKFRTYKPETKHMPFHTRLLGKDRMALFSFIHSLNTVFGTSIFEPVAQQMGSASFQSASTHQKLDNKISAKAQEVIQNIIDQLNTASIRPNKPDEIKAIRSACRVGEMKSVKLTVVDLKLVSHSGDTYLIDIKSAKPNIGEFKGFKRTLLEWVAAFLATDPKANVHTLLAMPYNPYEPLPYSRWTMAGMIDLKQEIKVANEFWDFVGGDGAYDELLNVFETVGIAMRSEIDDHFATFK